MNGKTEIQKMSDERRKVKCWGSKFPIEFLDFLSETAKKYNMPKNRLIMRAIETYARILDNQLDKEQMK